MALGKKEDKQGAAAEYRKAVKLDPSLAVAWYNLAMGLSYERDTEGSANAMRRAVRLKPDWEEAHFYLGVLLEQQGDESGALAEYLEATREQPNNALAYSQTGAALLRLGCRNEAVEEFRRAASLSPNDPKAHATLGGALYASGDLKGSLAEYNTAIRLNPKDRSLRESRKAVSHRLKKGGQTRLASGKTEPPRCKNLASFSALLPFVQSIRTPAEQSTGNTPTRIHIGGGVEGPRRSYSPSPVYPQLARMAHLQGVVRLEAIIGKDGAILDLKVISGHPLLVKAAIDAVSHWRYQPTFLNGEPVEVATEIDVNFTLRH